MGPKNIIIGGIYKHCHGLRYWVEKIVLNATGYEEGLEQFPRFVLYTQLDQGKFPPGTVWVRSEKDFLGTTTIEGKVVKKFELIKVK